MSHKNKVRMARKMRTPDEIQKTDHKAHEGIFTSAAWERRHEDIAARVARQQEAAHERAIARKAAMTVKPIPKWRQRINASLEAMRQRRAARNIRYQAKHSHETQTTGAQA